MMKTVSGLQCLPSLFESVRNLCVTLAFRVTPHRGGHGHCGGLGRCPCSQIYSGTVWEVGEEVSEVVNGFDNMSTTPKPLRCGRGSGGSWWRGRV